MRFAVGVEYDGTQYAGFQRQQEEAVFTIQDKLESAISKVADHPVYITAAGRTDAGVHALGQVIHFDTSAVRNAHNWLLGINANLPDDISINWIKPVSEDFHARFSAVARCYEYKILNRLAPSALWHHRVLHYYSVILDAEKMQAAANVLVGEHDFSSFRAAGCQSRTPVRKIEWIQIRREKEFVNITIQANAFLHHMVRNITGVLLEVGSGKKPINYSQEILALKNRSLSSPTAKACGLYLTKVIYRDFFMVDNCL